MLPNTYLLFDSLCDANPMQSPVYLLRNGMPSDSVSGSGGGSTSTTGHGETCIILVDRYEVSAEIVLPREGAATAFMTAQVWLQAVGIVGSHMCLEIERSGKG